MDGLLGAESSSSEARPLKLSYRCSKCPLRPEHRAFDICRSCFKKGKWCQVRDHSLIKITVDSKGRQRERGTVSSIRYQRGLLILVDKLDSATGIFVPVFRLQPRDIRPNLHDSPAVLHPNRPLMATPAGYDQILLADLEHNLCSSWTHTLERMNCKYLESYF
jgi:hypothetical protein